MSGCTVRRYLERLLCADCLEILKCAFFCLFAFIYLGYDVHLDTGPSGSDLRGETKCS
jgi:hypothetical protein